ncbi:phage filamentation protein Fil family protein [Franconibacter helveticus 513]|uniref:phage filamentation protein Fil family protein n=1 Tax=Franconibacter helveticus TaxID=357240 RepID=UPI000411A358|nr:phage filamentation protein Fil family protein [Franconibacter helveticus]
MEPSLASLLVKQSPSMHYGHGWIVGKNGRRWHPSRDQSALLNSLRAGKKKSLVSRLKVFLESI